MYQSLIALLLWLLGTSPRYHGRGQVRERVVGMSSLKWGVSNSMRPSRDTARARQRGGMGAGQKPNSRKEVVLPSRRQHGSGGSK